MQGALHSAPFPNSSLPSVVGNGLCDINVVDLICKFRANAETSCRESTREAVQSTQQRICAYGGELIFAGIYVSSIMISWKPCLIPLRN